MPISAKSCAVPAHYRFGSHQDKAILPLRPNPLYANAKELIDPGQLRALLALFENGKLLAKSQVFE
jgi:hypothetical protein